MNTKRTWRFRSEATFYGLSDEYIESIYDQIFQLKYYGGWSFFEAYNLPIQIRTWFLNRLAQELQNEAETQDGRKTYTGDTSSNRGRSYNPS